MATALTERTLDVINVEPTEPDTLLHSVFGSAGEIVWIGRWSSAAAKHHAFIYFRTTQAMQTAANTRSLPRGWRCSRLNPDLRPRIVDLMPPSLVEAAERPGHAQSASTTAGPTTSAPNAVSAFTNRVTRQNTSNGTSNAPVYSSWSSTADSGWPFAKNNGLAPSTSANDVLSETRNAGTGAGPDTRNAQDSWTAMDWSFPVGSPVWMDAPRPSGIGGTTAPAIPPPPPPPGAPAGDFDPYDISVEELQRSLSARKEEDLALKTSAATTVRPDRSRSRFGPPPPRSPSPGWDRDRGNDRLMSSPKRIRNPSPPFRSPAAYRSSYNNAPSKSLPFAPDLRDPGPRYPERSKQRIDDALPLRRSSPPSRWTVGRRRSRSRSRSRDRDPRPQPLHREPRRGDRDSFTRFRDRASRSRSRTRSLSRGRTRSPPNRRGQWSNSTLNDGLQDHVDHNRLGRALARGPSPPPPSLVERLKITSVQSTSQNSTTPVEGSDTSKGPTVAVSSSALPSQIMRTVSNLEQSSNKALFQFLPPVPDKLIDVLIKEKSPSSAWLVLAAEYAKKDDLNTADWVAMSGVAALNKQPPPAPASTKPLLLFLANMQTTRAKKTPNNLAAANANLSKAAEWIQKAQALKISDGDHGTDQTDGLEWLKKHMFAKTNIAPASTNDPKNSKPTPTSSALPTSTAAAPQSIGDQVSPSTNGETPAISAIRKLEATELLSARLAEAQKAHQNVVSLLKAEQSARGRLQERVSALEELLRVAEAKAASAEVAERRTPQVAETDSEVLKRIEKEKNRLLAIISEERMAKRKAEDAEQEERNIRRKLEDQLWVLGGEAPI